MRISPSYNSIVYTATIAGIFSAVVAVVLVASFLNRQTRLALDDPKYQTLKSQLEQNAGDTETQAQLRALDGQLRRHYFQQQKFLQRGAYLLVGGVAATLLLAHWGTTVRRRLPQPKSATAHQVADTRSNQLGQWAAGTVGVVVLLIVLLSQVVYPSVLPVSLDELASASPTLPTPSHVNEIQTEIVGQTAPVQGAGPQAPNSNDLPPISPEQFARSWPRFRGPHGAGVSAFENVPTTWNGASGEGILWKSSSELPGMSSPIVWEDRVFLTGANEQRREVFCFAADSGNLLWQRAVGEAQSTEELEVSEETGFAAPTPATDGRRVFAMFANGDLVAFDLDGNELWYRNVGTPQNPYGHAASLTTYENLLIVQLDQGKQNDDKSKLMALRGSTGDVAWQVERAVRASWATPIVVQHAGQSQIITCAEPWVIAYAAEDGSEIWRADCLSGDVGPSPVYDDGVVYVANDSAVVAAIRADGQGDVTESHLLWTGDYALPDICSPLVTNKHVLLIASYGELACYDRTTGGEEPLWEEDFESIFGASPSRVGDRVYLISDEGKGWVVRPNDTGCERLAENDLGERCFASPAFQSGRIYIRGEEHLFCIGQPQRD